MRKYFFPKLNPVLRGAIFLTLKSLSLHEVSKKHITIIFLSEKNRHRRMQI